MANCAKPWISDPERLCEAKAIPAHTACLAHVDPALRREFLAAVPENPASMTGLLRNLEVHDELQADLVSILTFVNFGGSHFTGKVDFSRCRFRRRVYFDGAVFAKEANFAYAQFDKEVSFNGARFDADARFDLATFASYATFGSDFRSGVWFDRAKFKSWVSVLVQNGIRVIFDGAHLSTVMLDAYQPPQGADPLSGGSQAPTPLVMFHGASFTGNSEVRTRTDVDVSLAGIVLRNSLPLACWQGQRR